MRGRQFMVPRGSSTLLVALLLLQGCTHLTATSESTVSGATHSEKGGRVTQQMTLDNGLKVIVREDHRAPIIVSQIWYKVGSSYESGAVTGVSHALEHMMFKGTERYAAGEFSRIIAAAGGRENAFTGRDYTAYFQQLERRHLPLALELEADRMRNLILPEEEFEKEREVVIEERRSRTEDKPNSLTYEQFMATASLSGPYHSPIIGWMGDLERMSVADLRSWYQRWYRPNNATLVVAGDVSSSEVFSLARLHFGDISNSDQAPLPERLDSAQRGLREITVQAPAKLPIILMGYKAPSLRTSGDEATAYALEVLAQVLDSSDSARLSRALVRGTEIAASAGAGYNLLSRHQTLFTLEGIPAAGHTIAELERALRGEVTRLQQELVEPQELDRIKALTTASKVYELDSVFYQAMEIGTLETIGLDWRAADNYLAGIEAVTPEQLRAVAKEYLVDEQLTIARLKPLPLDSKQPKPSVGGKHGGH